VLALNPLRWDIVTVRIAPAVESRQVDGKRRLIMPPACPPRAAVTIQQLDSDTWLVKRHRPRKDYKIVLIPAIDRLPDDPEWEKTELAIVRHCSRQVPPFGE
jgi:hypothetical protein